MIPETADTPSPIWITTNYWFSAVFFMAYLGYTVIVTLSAFAGSSGDFPIFYALPLWILACVPLALFFRYSRRLSRGLLPFKSLTWLSYQGVPFVYLAYAHNFLFGHGTLAHLPFDETILFLAMPVTLVPLHYLLLPVQLYLVASWSERLKSSLGYIAFAVYLAVLTPLYQELLSLKSSATLRDMGSLSYSYYLPLLVATPFILWGLVRLALPSLRKTNWIMTGVVTLTALSIGFACLVHDQAASKSLVVDAGTAACSENHLANTPELITFMREGDLWLTDSNGRLATQITHSANENYLVIHSISPDSRYIAYSETHKTGALGSYGQEGEASVIHVVDLSTFADTALPADLKNGKLYSAIEWSEKDELKFKLSSSFGNYTEQAFSLNGKPLDPSSVHTVPESRKKVVSPDSQYKIEGVAKSGYTQHYIVKVDGSVRSVEIPKGASYVRWLNDSRRIVLMSPEGMKVMDICGNSTSITPYGSDRAPIEQ